MIWRGIFLKVYETVAGSSIFQVILIRSGTSVIKTSPRLCMCKECKNKFGSCSLYKERDLIGHHLNKVSSRSNFVNEYRPDCEGTTAVNKFIAKDSVVAVAAPNKHTDTILVIMVTSDEVTTNKPIVDGYYGNTIATGEVFFTGQSLEQTSSQTVYVQIKKNILL